MAVLLTRNEAPVVGDIRVSRRGDYVAGKVTAERYDYFNQIPPTWAMPAWDKAGMPELMGHFDSAQDIYKILRAYGVDFI